MEWSEDLERHVGVGHGDILCRQWKPILDVRGVFVRPEQEHLPSQRVDSDCFER